MASAFRETLNIAVTLSDGNQSATVNGGNVKALRLSLKPFGFEGTIRLWVLAEADAYFALVCGQTLLELDLTVAKALYTTDPAPDPLALHTVVTGRKLREIASADVTGNPILYREYTFELCDPARALWSEHQPCAVYAKTSLEKLLKEHTPPKVAFECPWPALKRVRPMLCLGLGADSASFYDFVFWIADMEHGHLWYDYVEQSLSLSAEKPNVGACEELAFGAISGTSSIQVHFAPPPRASVRVQNHRDGATPELIVEQVNAEPGVRHDVLVHTALNAEAEARQATLRKRFATGAFDVKVDCGAYPEMYLAPGRTVSLANEFGSSLFVSQKPLRVTHLELVADATHQTPEHDIESSTTQYAVEFSLSLEAADDPRWRGFEYQTPRYPLRVEGKVLSAVGNTGERAYTVYAESDASDTYKVQFALWNCTISVPMNPDFMPGHFYFPVYKDSRVFVALELESARIERFLDWGKDVTLPSASQGNHLLLGRSDTSETSIKHWYVDNLPELVIGRINAGDLGTVTVKEGTLTLELTEESSSSGFGATVSVEPQAQMAKAEASQKSELAVADLQDASQAASAELSGTAQQAASAVKQQAEELGSTVSRASTRVEQALVGVGAGIDTQAEAVKGVLQQARRDLEDLLK